MAIVWADAGFEATVTEWVFTGTAAEDTGNEKTGSACIAMADADTATTVTAVTGLTKGELYLVKGFVKTDSITDPASITVHVQEGGAGDWKQAGEKVPVEAGTAAYTAFQTGQVAIDDTTCQVRFSCNSGSGTMYLDDVSIETATRTVNVVPYDAAEEINAFGVSDPLDPTASLHGTKDGGNRRWAVDVRVVNQLEKVGLVIEP